MGTAGESGPLGLPPFSNKAFLSSSQPGGQGICFPPASVFARRTSAGRRRRQARVFSPFRIFSPSPCGGYKLGAKRHRPPLLAPGAAFTNDSALQGGSFVAFPSFWSSPPPPRGLLPSASRTSVPLCECHGRAGLFFFRERPSKTGPPPSRQTPPHSPFSGPARTTRPRPSDPVPALVDFFL